jgi:hypothetical protein
MLMPLMHVYLGFAAYVGYNSIDMLIVIICAPG